MEMRAIDDIAIGQDITPPLPPLAAALHDSALSSHCSACFSPLPPQPFSPSKPQITLSATLTLLYCSSHCSSLDEPLRLSSCETNLLSTWEESSDLRLAIRLLHIFQKNPQNDCALGRISGLLTNWKMLVSREVDDDDCDSGDRIREGAKAMAVARRMYLGSNLEDSEGCELEEMMLCLVATNAVEVQDKNGSFIGIAVYGTDFSWINHSCSPNACYRFSVGLEHNEQQYINISSNVVQNLDFQAADIGYERIGIYGHGPRVIVRSIRDVKKGKEVTIAYTDLLQPKDMRQAELWSKYKFRCECNRCRAVPATYVDSSLQAISIADLDSVDTISSQNFSNDTNQLIERFDDAISDYLSFSNPESCCENLENLLSGDDKFDEQSELNRAEPLPKPNLHILHHVLLNAYITLASAYKSRATDLLALDYSTDVHELQAFNFYKSSVAYSLLLAGVTHHLFMFDSGLLASAANFWTHAGESLLNLSRSSFWDSFEDFDVWSILSRKCSDCSITDVFKYGNIREVRLEEMNLQQLNCTTSLSSEVWHTLANGSRFLKFIQNPIDFRWLESKEYVRISDGFFRVECEETRINMILLGSHCLRYGALLSSICYGHPLSIEMFNNTTPGYC